MFDNYIDEKKNDIINTTCELIKFKSVSLENTDNSEYPFGEECAKVLNNTLELGKQMGFRVKNIDNYCGYIEFGEGEELVGIIGHLDVVPANASDGWTFPPFEPHIQNGKIFGRGAIDDKGPVVAALYAMKAVYDTFKVNKRVRLILGVNEEVNWKCIKHYKENEESPTISFSPDANFPAIYAEKGILSIELKNPFFIKDMKIIDIDCHKNAINVVPKYCSITLESNEDFWVQDLINNNSYDNIKIEKLSEQTFKIESFGIQAHAAHPELGKNAITNLISYLKQNFEIEDNLLEEFYKLGLFEIESPKFMSPSNPIQDESGILTSNVAILEFKENNLIIKINLRVPVKTSLNSIIEKYKELKTQFQNIQIQVLGIQNPLYVPKDSYLVKTLVDIFNKKTGLNEEAIPIGGGTYARAFKNSISYGLTFPGDKDMCHQVDEFIEIDKLILGSKIYANAIYELAK